MVSAGGAAATYVYLKRKKKEKEDELGMRRSQHHKNVGRTIEEWQENGWSLHCYTTTGNPGAISHCLLFKRRG